MIDYFLKVLLFQALFLLIYDLLLKRETFFQWNRVYLLVTPVIAYLIPMIEINQVSKSVPEEFMLVLPEVIVSPESVIEQQVSWYTSGYDFLGWALWLGGIIAAILFFIKLYKVIRLIQSNERIKHDAYCLIFTKELSAFSFFKYIFLHKGLTDKDKQQVIDHELVHVGQWHSIDLLVFEVQRIVFWFNPFSYIYQHRIAMLHEYIADAKSIKPGGKRAYFQALLNTAFGTKNISFINPFFEKTTIKKRMVMFGKSRSRTILKLKYVVVLPLLNLMLMYSSCDNNQLEKNSYPNNEKKFITLSFGGMSDQPIRSMTSDKKKGYFDIYMLFRGQPPGTEISYEDLTKEEKDEYDAYRQEKLFNVAYTTARIFVDEKGRKSLLMNIDYQKKFSLEKANNYEKAAVVPYANVDQPPIYPGCEEALDQFSCFQENVREHVQNNFNVPTAKSLGLAPGNKRIYVQFQIKKDGMISQVMVRGPHSTLEDLAQNIVYDLPLMSPGSHNGKAVAVKYTLPITLMID